ncbi:natural resistance-associated macrophage protein-domain-containing protein [Umbelopsis sp. AD052]|nr:natural resistance-associated macrophage protein-domain-containing protein [Umbelopsis sp. AD052]
MLPHLKLMRGFKTMFGSCKQTLAYFLRFVGPGFIIAVGYLDPGNWASDAEAGSQFGYKLLFIILLSNIMAIYLQYLAIRLGTVSGLDLSQACRKFLPRWLNFILYLLCEAAIVSCDLAEVIGSAIALNLLFNLALPIGVAITGLDVLIILAFYKDDTKSLRIVRVFEVFVMVLVLTVGICFTIELVYSKPVGVDVLKGYLPSRDIFTDPSMLYVAISIIGATVMPHNLYLHSSLVQARCGNWKDTRPSLRDAIDIRQSQNDLDFAIKRHLRYSFWDLFIALLFAFFVNSAILIVFSANFYSASSQTVVGDLFEAHALLKQYLGSAAAVIFALALLCSGQSSTLTATLAGQIIMSGFLGITSRPWLRRLVTRLIAIVPAMIAAAVAGKEGLSNMLIASQVALSIQLPFAVIPLVVFTGMKRVMTISVYKDEASHKRLDSELADNHSDDDNSKSIKSGKTTNNDSRPASMIQDTNEHALEMDIMSVSSKESNNVVKRTVITLFMGTSG